MMTFSMINLSTFILALVAMAFFTLLERKILGYMQTRKGPNKVAIIGLPQPLADALKLFTKSQSIPMNANKNMFLLSPMMSLSLALILWTLMPSISTANFFKYGLIFFLCVSSLSVYTTIGMGWSSNSKYALLGALRSVAQTISYEVTLSLWMLAAIILIGTMNIQWAFNNSMFNVSLMIPSMMYIWFICLLAETNRTPFDFTEGESELVSGFNTEYASSSFAFIFMSEYMNIMFVSIMSSCLFLQNFTNPVTSFTMMIMQSVVLMSMFILIRGTLPRMRYDRLMNLTWMSFLPMSLMFNLLMVSMYFLPSSKPLYLG